MRNPLVLTLAGVTVGLAAVLPIAQAQMDAATAPAISVVQTAPPGDGQGAATVTVRGPVVATRYGPVQVEAVLTSGRLTAVTAVQTPDGDDDSRQINRYAVPRLTAEALAAQSAAIDTVSGATWTSNGYRQSLQAALDHARAAAVKPLADGASRP